jgi:hypothetical protein
VPAGVLLEPVVVAAFRRVFTKMTHVRSDEIRAEATR